MSCAVLSFLRKIGQAIGDIMAALILYLGIKIEFPPHNVDRNDKVLADGEDILIAPPPSRSINFLIP